MRWSPPTSKGTLHAAPSGYTQVCTEVRGARADVQNLFPFVVGVQSPVFLKKRKKKEAENLVLKSP